MDASNTNTNEVARTDQAVTGRVDMKSEQIRFLYRNATTGLFVNLALALLVVWILWQRVPQQVLMYWFGTLMLISALRGLKFARFRTLQPDDSSMPGWLLAFIIGSTLTGLIWGSLIWLFSPFDNLEVPVFLAFTLGGLMAGAAAILGSVLAVYLAYILVIMGPITIWFLIQPDEIYLFMGVMLSVAIIAFVATGMIHRKALISSIILSNKLIDAKEEAEIANAAKSEFLARMSHKLRAPLGAIREFAQSHKVDMSYSDVHQKNTSDLLRASNQLQDSISNLLDLAKVEARMVNLNIITVDCAGLIQECIESVRPLALENDVRLDFHLQAPAGVTVMADHARLKQMLINLLGNACQYNRAGGSVTVSCMPADDGRVRISVQDTGIGISAEQAKNLFHSYQFSAHKDTILEGSGLGLMLVKQLAEMMAGKVGFDSTPGEGSLFWVELPGLQPL